MRTTSGFKRGSAAQSQEDRPSSAADLVSVSMNSPKQGSSGNYTPSNSDSLPSGTKNSFGKFRNVVSGEKVTSFFQLRHRSVRLKLLAAILIPTTAFVLVAGINIVDTVRQANKADVGLLLARVSERGVDLTHQLQIERSIVAGRIRSAAVGDNQTLTSTRRNVDLAVSAYRSAENSAYSDFPREYSSHIEAIRQSLDGLVDLRTATDRKSTTWKAAFDEYSQIISQIIQLENDLSQAVSGTSFAASLLSLANLSQYKEAESQVQAELNGIISAGAFGFGEYQRFADSLAQREVSLKAFRFQANESELAAYDDIVKSQALLSVKRIEDAATNRQGNSELDLDTSQWLAASTTKAELIRTAEKQLVSQSRTATEGYSSSTWNNVIINVAILFVVLAVALAISLWIAQSMAGPLRILRSAALNVAENRLPEAIDRLRQNDVSAESMSINPVGIDSDDEIGQVARAFDAVHYEALRLASEQAVLRRNVSVMFTNLSRRSQGLVERQLSLIDQLEEDEKDPDQLDNLFKLDHLATRMRRNNESLLVLAGNDIAPRWNTPIALSDVILAATSEVEDYQRIDRGSHADIEIVGHVVSDLIHLMAELLENATTFSPPTSQISLNTSICPDSRSLVININDQGIGMSDSEIEQINDQLLAPRVDVDLAAGHVMGLFVVARLASRHEIVVQLMKNNPVGLTASIMIPENLVTRQGALLHTRSSANLVETKPEPAVKKAATEQAPRDLLLPTPRTHQQDQPVGQHARPESQEQVSATPQQVQALSNEVTTELPIYNLVSAWFQNVAPDSVSPQSPVVATQVPVQASIHNQLEPELATVGSSSVTWQSPADEGWKAAEAAVTKAPERVTKSGLPIRVPMAHYVPGTADGLTSEENSQTSKSSSHAAKQPELVGNSLASFYHGVREGRQKEQPE